MASQCVKPGFAPGFLPLRFSIPDAGIVSTGDSFVFSVLKVFTSRYFVAPALAGLGIAAGVLIFLYVFPGTPKIGVIDIPFTVITENSAYVIGEYLNHARRDDSIKAVVIKLESPGGGAAASERLYVETKKLREEKPVVIVMDGLVASGGYMMSMGASHTIAQTSSIVGNVGVISFAGPLIAPFPSEEVIVSGPYKFEGSTRREWIGTVDLLKSAFAKVVVTERGDKLLLTEDELTQGRIYVGLEAARLGLVDEIGGESDGFEKAADLAGISSYGLVDVNLEVLKKFVKDFEDVFPAEAVSERDLADAMGLSSMSNGEGLASRQGLPGEANEESDMIQALQGLMLYGRLNTNQEDLPPDFPLELNNRPHIYYMYVGNAR